MRRLPKVRPKIASLHRRGCRSVKFTVPADRLSRNARDEWAKVQGRFQNVPFVAQADEVAALLARAITTAIKPADTISRAADRDCRRQSPAR
jgi:hypothetical protein